MKEPDPDLVIFIEFASFKCNESRVNTKSISPFPSQKKLSIKK